MKTLVRLLMAAGILMLAAACGGPSTDGTQGGYITGKGSPITVVKPADRKAAPVIEGKDLEGQRISTGDWKGKVIVVNSWGSWCPPCRAESAALDAVARRTKSQGVEFLGIAQREDAPTTLAFTRTHNVSYPSISDPSGKLQLGFRTSLPSIAIPTTWIVDADGRVAVRIVDKVGESTLAGLIHDVQKSTS